MTFELGFRLASYGLAATGFLALALTGEVAPWLVGLGFAGLLVAWWLAGRPGRRDRSPGDASERRAPARLGRVPDRLWTLLSVLVALLVLADLVLFGKALVVAVVELLVALQLIKLLSARSDRDYFQVYAISFFQLLAASTLSESLGFAVSFLLYMLLATWTFLAFHLRQEMAGQPAGDPFAARGLLTLPFLATTTLVALGTLVVTVAIFFVLPRVGRGFFRQAAGEPVRLSGFSDVVRLGEVGQIKTDSTVVMRVQAPAPEALDEPIRFWRGTAFDRYDGRAWSRSVVDKRQLAPDGSGRIVLAPGRPGGRTVRQVVSLEPTDTAVLFGASQPVALEPSPRQGRSFPFVYRDGMGSVTAPWVPYARIEYAVESDLARPPAARLRAAGSDYPPGVERYLEVPALDPRVAALAAAVTKGAETPYDRAVALEQHLRTAYGYSLAVRPSADRPPLEDFLFYTKSGYCEYSATAMAILLRLVGIPSRLVSGFLRGEWNEYGGYYVVRQSDAHTWVEAYFPGEGWVAFDPTPPAGTEPAASGPLGALARYVDALRSRWDRYVVGYSLADQVTAVRAIRGRTLDLAADVRGALAAAGSRLAATLVQLRELELPQWVAWPSLALLALIGLRGRALLRRTRVGAFLERRRLNRELLRLYRRGAALAAARGLPRRPTQTAREHAAAARRAGLAGADGLETLARLHDAVRFGTYRATPVDVAAARAALARLRGPQGDGRRQPPALDSRA